MPSHAVLLLKHFETRIYLRPINAFVNRSKAWFKLPLLPEFPLEPVLKISGCAIGIIGELWFGQVHFT